MDESLPEFSIIESSINKNKASNVPLTDTHNNSLIETVDCNLFQKGDWTLTSTPAPETQKMSCKNPIISIKHVTENHETKFSKTTKRLIKIVGEQEYIIEYDKRSLTRTMRTLLDIGTSLLKLRLKLYVKKII